MYKYEACYNKISQLTFAHEFHYVAEILVVVATAAGNFDFFEEKGPEVDAELRNNVR